VKERITFKPVDPIEPKSQYSAEFDKFDEMMARKAKVVEETRDEVCPDHGKFVSRYHDLGGQWSHWSKCPECQKREELKREEERRREQHKEWLESLVQQARIPTRFQGKTFENYEVKNAGQRRALATAKDYAEKFGDHLAAGRCLTLTGKCGTGKTHLAAAIATTVARSGKRVLYANSIDLIRRIRRTWDHGALKNEADLLRNLTDLALLIIDEVALSYGTDSEVQQLSELVDRRYCEVRPVVIISNVGMAELPRYLGDRAVDRLRENGGKVVIFDWDSHRGKNV